MPKPRYCWDACLFIAHLMGERRTEEEAAGLREVLEMIRTGRAHIITSVVVYSEVLNRPADGARARDQLNLMLNRPGFTVVDTNSAISNKAAEYRERANPYGRPGPLRRNDALYAATAVLYEAEALHTFDPALLALSGSPFLDNLRITPPHGAQTTLALDEQAP